MTPNTDALPPLPERDTSKPAEQQGLFRKFIVTRTDGSSEPGGKHEHCEYFVLDVDHDPHAAAALAAYADALAAYADAVERTHPELAADMRQRYTLAQRQQAPERRPDGMPASADERYLRRLLAVRSGIFGAYFDDGEAQGQESGIVIDFMREPVADIDAKLRALSVARAALTAAPSAQAEPVAWRREWDGDDSDLGAWVYVSAGEERDGDGPWQPLYAAPPTAQAEPQEPTQRPALVTALRGLLASLSRQPTEFELRAAAHEFTLMADRAAAAARQGGDDA